ncbi:methyl-CpG-binding domain protein 1b isoform X2 [Gouania willdenowi]|uniref:Uncharacterized LOC114463870 n=1 Tax=Gouania willdenowi TaxID=441366 RepID=A0A8C5D4U2_GOUWI|nr:uncharacterized protein LOC114463870 isoform X2 [Gouania willdenowi]
MAEEQVQNPLPDTDTVEQDVDQSNQEKTNDTAEKTEPDPDPSQPSDDTDTKVDPSPQPKVEAKPEEAKTIAAEPPIDWFEPLEEDDDDEEALMGESLAGESERSESVAGSEKASRKLVNSLQPRPRRRNRPDEGWEDWPALGLGWKRREVMRRSGSSIGQTDVYYISPQGDRVRSRPGLVSVLEGQVDLSRFDFKSGKFIDGINQPTKVRKRAKRKIKELSSSDSSAEEEDGDRDTPDSYQRLTPNQGSRIFPSKDFWNTKTGSTTQGIYRNDGDEKPTFSIPSSSKVLPLLSINGNMDSEQNSLVCSRCGITFNGTWYDKQRKKPCCPSCWDLSKAKEHPMIRFRKWLPCGECVSCRNNINCGQCHNCTNESQSEEPRKRICQKRKCKIPIRRDPSSEDLPQTDPISSLPDVFDDSTSVKSENTDSQLTTLKNSDAENVTVNIDLDDDDEMTTDDDDDRHLLPFQFEHQGDYVPEPPKKPGRPKIHYTYSRKSNMKKTKGPSGESHDEEDDDYSHTQPLKWSFENNEGSKRHFDINLKNTKSSMQHFNHATLVIRNGLSERVPPISIHQSPQMPLSRPETGNSLTHIADPKQVDRNSDEDELPMITNVFSYADIPAASGSDVENQLMKLLHSLRASVLPIMWYAILVEGPQLQLIQCSKQSNMSDTMVLIDPGFSYQVTVQKQPLMPTHPLYDSNPALLSTVTDVVTLLLGLEQFIVCQGVPPKEPSLSREPIVLERAPICDFLVEKDVGVCSHCKQLQEL